LPTIGRWRLTRLIGAGQWTRVYRAAPVEAPRGQPGDFVLKTLAPEFAADPVARVILRREAWVCRQTQHPHLATVLADHSTDEPPHLVLPHLEGVTLRQVVRRGPLPVATALLIVRQTAEALAAMHKAGCLHGDVKPENVLVAPSGHATLVDLGLARRLRSEECSTRLAVAATLGYAAPEMFSPGEWLSGAADVYSLGIVLAELLTGRPPFVAANAAELVRLHRRETPPDVRLRRPAIAAELAELIRGMLAKEPLRRPEAARLVRLLVEQEIVALGTPR
jgi:serine/threonine-protein kinase